MVETEKKRAFPPPPTAEQVGVIISEMNAGNYQDAYKCLEDSYYSSNPIFKIINLTKEDFKSIFYPICADKNNWKASILAIDKENPTLVVGYKICYDLKLIKNPYLEENKHPNPVIQDKRQIDWDLYGDIVAKGNFEQGQFNVSLSGVIKEWQKKNVTNLLNDLLLKKLWELKYKAEISIIYNEIMYKMLIKYGGYVINEIDITQREIDGKKLFLDYKECAKCVRFDFSEQIMRKLAPNLFEN